MKKKACQTFINTYPNYKTEVEAKRAEIIATPYTFNPKNERPPFGECGSEIASLFGIENRLIVQVGVLWLF